jgi:hypothetical protein
MIKQTALALAAIGLFGLAACETATPYQPAAPHNAVAGGFTDQRLDDTHFRVTFSGNDATARGRVEAYMLYRAADLAVGEGFDWFEMVDRHTHDTGEAFVSPLYGRAWRPDWSFEWRAGASPWGGPFAGSYDVERIDRYEATADIFVGRGAKPANDPRAFDARQVMNNLGPKIVRPS